MEGRVYSFVPPTFNYQSITPDDLWIVESTGGIFIYTQKKPIRIGSGFNIGNGYFLTAGHCCINQDFIIQGNETKFSVNFEHGKRKQHHYKIEKVLCARNKGYIDFAILKLENNNEAYVNLCYADPYKNCLGMGVIAAHHPQGQEMKISHGVISVMDNDISGSTMNDIPVLFRYTLTTMPGSSGGPIGLPANKLILGVHVQGNQFNQGYHAATSIQAIDAYLKKIMQLQNGLGEFTTKKEMPSAPESDAIIAEIIAEMELERALDYIKKAHRASISKNPAISPTPYYEKAFLHFKNVAKDESNSKVIRSAAAYNMWKLASKKKVNINDDEKILRYLKFSATLGNQIAKAKLEELKQRQNSGQMPGFGK